MKFTQFTNGWFFSHPSFFLKPFLIFVRGDGLVLIPFWIGVGIIGIFSLPWMMVVVGVYWATRSFGEMIYWLLQQFGDRKYRPYDYGFKSLDNNAIYILYQLNSLVGMVLGISFLIFVLHNIF